MAAAVTVRSAAAPSAEKCCSHHCGSEELRALPSAPTTRKDATSTDSDSVVIDAALEAETYAQMAHTRPMVKAPA